MITSILMTMLGIAKFFTDSHRTWIDYLLLAEEIAFQIVNLAMAYPIYTEYSWRLSKKLGVDAAVRGLFQSYLVTMTLNKFQLMFTILAVVSSGDGISFYCASAFLLGPTHPTDPDGLINFSQATRVPGRFGGTVCSSLTEPISRVAGMYFLFLLHFQCRNRYDFRYHLSRDRLPRGHLVLAGSSPGEQNRARNFLRSGTLAPWVLFLLVLQDWIHH